MKFGPQRKVTREKAGRVKLVAQLIRESLDKTAKDIDLNIVSELEKIDKRAEEQAKLEVISGLRQKLEMTSLEGGSKPAFDLLRKKFKAEGLITVKEGQEENALQANQVDDKKSPLMISLGASVRQKLSSVPDKVDGVQTKIPDMKLDPRIKAMSNAGTVFNANAGGIVNAASMAHDPKIVVFPKYEVLSDGSKNYYTELDPPSKDAYVALGYDSKGHGEHKHYRKFIDSQLEDTDFMTGNSFKSLPINTGKKVATQKRTWLQRWMFREDTYKRVGLFNGTFMLIEEELLRAIEDMRINPLYLDLFGLPASVEDWVFSKHDKNILVPHKVIVRLYVIDATISEDTDFGSDPDPYLKISLGTQEIDVSPNKFRNQIPM